MLKITMLLLVATLTAAAQTSPSRHPGWCNFRPSENLAPKADVLEPNEYAIPRGNLCSHYTYEAGWDKTMRLLLGEGSEEYLEWIKMAVDVWNDAIRRQSFGPLIEIYHDRPKNYRIARSFWEDLEADDDAVADQKDGENVIYFRPATERTWTLGAAAVRSTNFGNSITEADIYINTRLEEIRGGQVAETVRLFGYSHDSDYAVYLYYHQAYVTILHELGHAIGLGHIPLADNIMSYDRWDGFRKQWEAPMSLYVHMLHSRFGKDAVANDFFVDREEDHWGGYNTFAPLSDDRYRILTNFYTSRLRLGEMEKMMLTCSYDFDDLELGY